MEQVQTGFRLDPLNNWFRIEVGARLAWMGKFDEGLENFLEVTGEEPNWFMIYRYLWEVYFYIENREQALAAAGKYFELSGQPQMAAIVERHDGSTEFSTAMLALADEMISGSSESHVSDVEVARLYAFAENRDLTLEWLERAQSNRDSALIYTASQPLFAFVWEDPRYAALREKMNLTK